MIDFLGTRLATGLISSVHAKCQIINFQNCLDPASYYDFVVDDSLVLSGDTIFADYQCWSSTGNVGGGPTGTVIFTGYTTCEQCNDDFNGWQFEHCQIPGSFIYFGLKNKGPSVENTGPLIACHMKILLTEELV